MKNKSFFILLFTVMAISVQSSSAQNLSPDDCVWRLIKYDIQSHRDLSDVSVSFKNGRADLNLFGSSNSRWSNATRLAIQRGERLTSIVRRDRAVSSLIALEKRIRQIPLVTSVSWTADKPCKPGFVCQTTGGYIEPAIVASCAAYRNAGPIPVKLGGFGVYKKPLDGLVPAKVGRFRLLEKANGPIPLKGATDSAGGIYVSNNKKVLQLTIINFADVDGPGKAMKEIVTDDGRRSRNTYSEGPAKIKNGKVVGKRYNAIFIGYDGAFAFWSNGSVLIMLQSMDNTKRELNLKPADTADLKAFENALSF